MHHVNPKELIQVQHDKYRVTVLYETPARSASFRSTVDLIEFLDRAVTDGGGQVTVEISRDGGEEA